VDPFGLLLANDQVLDCSAALYQEYSVGIATFGITRAGDW
jgi:hypothetical protein